MRSKLGVVLSVFLITSTWISNAWGWGSLGHQFSNVIAVELLQENPEGQKLGAWFDAQVGKLIQRLAVTPDRDWKRAGKAPTDDGERRLIDSIDPFEHRLHFLELDALLLEDVLKTPGAIDKLPAGRFKDVAQTLLDLLKQRAEYLNGIEDNPNKRIKDPQHPTIDELANHGVAAWRILQLHDLAVQALKDKKFKLALLYLGTVGHYTADITQPFHGTINYDGQLSKADGIHSAFESLIFNVSAGDEHITVDKQTHLWPSFGSMHEGAHKAAQDAFSKMDHSILTEKQIVSEAYQTVINGYPYVEFLAKIFSRLRPTEDIKVDDLDKIKKMGGEKHLVAHESTCGAALKGGHISGFVPRQTVRDFRDSTIRVKGQDPITVLNYAEKRVGAAAALTAQVWMSAYKAAGSPTLEGKFSFEDLDVQVNYPKPNFIP